MIKDTLKLSAHQNINIYDRSAKPYKKLIEESLLIKFEERGILLNSISIQVLDLSGRASTRLRIANINTIKQLVDCSENTLLNIPHVGITIVDEIKNKLNLYLTKELNKKYYKPFTTSKASESQQMKRTLAKENNPFLLFKGMSKLLQRLGYRNK